MKLFQSGLELFISAIADASVSQQAVALHVAVAVATAVRHRRMQPAYTPVFPSSLVHPAPHAPPDGDRR